jgi:DNA-binding phage protein
MKKSLAMRKFGARYKLSLPAAPGGRASGRLSQALKDALRASDKTMYQIAQDAGVSQIVISRFLSGERDIRMATADKIAEALRLKIAAAS